MLWPLPSDYQEAIQNPKHCFSDPELKNGTPVRDRLSLPRPMTGGFASVYAMNCNGRKYAVRCFLRFYPDQVKRYDLIGKYLQKVHSPYMVGFKLLQEGIRIKGQWYPIVKMEWVEGDPLIQYIQKNLQNSQTLFGLAQNFGNLLLDLGRNSIAHGDLQHGNILILNNGDIRLVDYDGMYVPDLQGMPSHELGHPNYQHPKRTEADFGPYLDNFSAWIIYSSFIALGVDPPLWYRLGGGDDCLLFRRKDYINPTTSDTFSELEREISGDIQSLVSLVRSIVYSAEISKIPPLDAAQTPAPVPAATTIPTPTSSSSVRGAAWVLTHAEVKPVSMGASARIGRFAPIAFLSLAALIGAAGRQGILTPFDASVGVWFLFFFIVLLSYTHYLSLSEVRQKRDLLTKVRQIGRELSKHRKMVARLNADWGRLENEERIKIANTSTSQRELGQAETNELAPIEREFQTAMTNINSRRQIIRNQEAQERSKALTDYQNQMINSFLVRYDIATANINKLGQENKRQLEAAGIRTAADVKVRFVSGRSGYSTKMAIFELPGGGSSRVPGIGHVKATALQNWRRALEQQFRPNIPQSLPQAQSTALSSKYQNLLKPLDLEETRAQHVADQKKTTIRDSYRQRQLLIAKQLQDFQGQTRKNQNELDIQIAKENDEISKLEWSVGGTKQQLLNYAKVNLKAYTEYILFKN